MARNFVNMILVSLCINNAVSIHFRGGTFYWAPVSNVSAVTINVSITQSYSWVRTYEFCDSSTIALQGSIGANTTQLQCISGCVNSGSYCNCITTDVICTDYSITQDLSSGQKVTFTSIGQNSKFYLTYQDSNWLPLATAASASWSITSYVNLALRSDNGLINTPPVVGVLPVIHLPVSVQSVINLLVVDVDNDAIQCRWAHSGGVDECGGVCQSVTGSQLLSNCSLILTPTVSQVYYAVAIMVEDFYPSSSLTTPLSSTPVQFLIYTYNSPIGCSTLPKIIGPYSDRSCLDVQVGIPFSFTLTAQIGCSGTTITDFVTVSPIGMIKASSIVTVISTVYSLNFNWIPSSLQIGPQIFCAAAIGTYNIQSQQICWKFIVNLGGNSSACPPTTTTITTIATIRTTTTPQTDSNDYMRYVFLAIGIAAGFICAMAAMWAIHYFVHREVCCLKPKNNYQQTSTTLNLSTLTNSRQAFT